MLVLPALGQVVPAFTAAIEFGVAKKGNDIASEIRRICHDRFMVLMLVRALLQMNRKWTSTTAVAA